MDKSYTKTDIASEILKLALNRGCDKSICPSEVARSLYPSTWRKHMTEIVDVAIALEQTGKVVITQNHIPIDTDNIKGPIRITIKKN